MNGSARGGSVVRHQMSHQFEHEQSTFFDVSFGPGSRSVGGFQFESRAVNVDYISRARTQEPELIAKSTHGVDQFRLGTILSAAQSRVE